VAKRRLFQDWPLAAFTLAIQVACGIAIAVTFSDSLQLSTRPSELRALGVAVFPTVAVGLLLSLLHVGRPFSAWRALSNSSQSRLSLEVLLTSAFAVLAFVHSLIWFSGATTFRVQTGAVASVLGVAAVLSSAAIYKLPTRPIWNSAWVMTSFIASTVTVAGLALLGCSTAVRLGTAAVLAGSALLLFSGAWMWARFSPTVETAKWPRISFVGHLLLVVATPVILISIPAASAPSSRLAVACLTVVLAVITGRMLMLVLAELPARF
jgi:anaerobic dimethyl sulfoxide reductase subunit C (anchor subunit)